MVLATYNLLFCREAAFVIRAYWPLVSLNKAGYWDPYFLRGCRLHRYVGAAGYQSREFFSLRNTIYVGVEPKIGVFPPKWMVKNNGKPHFSTDDLGEKVPPLFRKQPCHVRCCGRFSAVNSSRWSQWNCWNCMESPFAAELFSPKTWGQMRFKRPRHDKGNVTSEIHQQSLYTWCFSF